MNRRHRVVVMMLVILGAALLFSCKTIIGEPDEGPEIAPVPPGGGFPYDMYIEGKPKESVFPLYGGYFIWKQGNRWHLRIASRSGFPPGAFPPVYSGTISFTNGLILPSSRQRYLLPDRVEYMQDQVSFRFDLSELPKGFDFEVRPLGLEYCADFDLRINGRTVPEAIHLGRTMYVPQSPAVSFCVR